MILNILFFVIDEFVRIFSAFFPGAGQTPLLLPYGLDSIFVTASSYFHLVMTTFPYLQTLWQFFMYGLLFELAMLVFKLVLGSRTPGKELN